MNYFTVASKKISAFVLLISVFGCIVGEEQQYYISKDVIEIFNQGGGTSQSINIVWVIDNSGSMSDEQAALGNSFSEFIGHFLEQNIDFKMAIITTDENQYENKDKENKLNLASAKENRVDFQNYFKEKISVGTSGSAMEKGLL
ncbi:MAG: hypothetical protein OXB84_04980, partial [Halobacteriovoraceae bacterium]|nr:hypothetical protein [Halobacteriovoraceae bacterium]